MTIIELTAREDGGHGLQSQSGRSSCWLEGWVEIPANLESAVWDTLGWCDLQIENGKLVGITPTERPEPDTDLVTTPTLEERPAALESAMLSMMGVKSNV